MLKGLPGVVWRAGGWREGKQGWECSSGEKGGKLLPQSPGGISQAGAAAGEGFSAFWAQQGDKPCPSVWDPMCCSARVCGVCVLFGV